MDNELAKDILKTFVHSDVGDAIVVASLKNSIDSAFSYLRQIQSRGYPEFMFQDAVDNIAFIRGCITVLQWYTVEDFTETTIEVNKYSVAMENMY